MWNQSASRHSIEITIRCLGAASLLASLATIAPAQQPQQQRRDLIEDLLKLVLEDTTPAQKPSTSPSVVSPKMRQALSAFDDFSGNVYQLARLIQQDVNRTGGLRTLLAEAIRLNASARTLAERSRQFDSVQPLREEFQELDQNWQLFKRRLNATYGIRSTIKDQLRICDELEKQLEQLFQVDRQIDRNALAQVAIEIASHLRNLQEDLEIEFGDTPRYRTLMASIRTVYEQNRRVASALRNRDSYDQLLPEYQHLSELWNPLSVELRQLEDRHIQRHMLRIDEAERSIRELMLLPRKFELDDVVHQAESLHQSVSDMMDVVTLRVLTELPSSNVGVIEASDNLRATCEDFSDCANSGDDQQTLVELYNYLESDWQRVNECLGKSRHEPVMTSVGEVQHAIDALRGLLGVELSFDRQQILDRATTVETMADSLNRQMRSYLSRPNSYPRQFQVDAAKASSDFQRAALELHDGVVNGEDLKTLRQRGTNLIEKWRLVSPYLPKFSSVERIALRAEKDQLTPLLVDLQSLLAL